MLTFLSLFLIGIVLYVNEYWWRSRNKTYLEHPRKIIHILVGTFIAFWPFYLSWTDIKIASVLFFVGVLISRNQSVLRAIHETDRLTAGEIFYALSFGIISFMTSSKWIFAAAIMQMSIADGLAGLIGKYYGEGNSYKILNATKSVIGSVTFLFASLIILISIRTAGHLVVSLPLLIFIALSATLTENVSVYGLDNLALPIYTALMLSRY